MGYTHYWRVPHTFTNLQWVSFTNEVKSLFASTKIPLANAFGDVGTDPIVNDTEIMFNGVDDDSCETCHITKDAVSFEFCKTHQRPYDSVVVEVLKLARKYNTSIHLSSDGDVFDSNDE